MQRGKERDSTAAEERETLSPTPAEDESSDDFEFAFFVSDGPTITADEIFSNGQIRPIYYPVFNEDAAAVAEKSEKKAENNSNSISKLKSKSIRLSLRSLMIEDRESCSRSASISSTSSSSSTAELDGISPDTYCAWTPRSAAPDRCEKSRSTGTSMRWRLRDLVVGRGHSTGTEKFVFLAAEKPKAEAEGKKGSGKGKGGKVTEMNIVNAHRLYYGGGGDGQVVKGGRRSFLPYKQDLFGFFAGEERVWICKEMKRDASS